MTVNRLLRPAADGHTVVSPSLLWTKTDLQSVSTILLRSARLDTRMCHCGGGGAALVVVKAVDYGQSRNGQ